MPLSCDCSDDADWWYIEPDGYEIMPALSRRKRCASCKALIEHGATVARFDCWRQAAPGSIEERIFGECADIELAPRYHCETCADLYFSLAELGFCVDPSESMRALAREYAEVYGKAAT